MPHDPSGTVDPHEAAILREIALLRDHDLFDVDWYLAHHPDVATAPDPVEHFVRHGWREGRDPGPRFSVQWYLHAYADVATSGLNPLVHYIDYGMDEGRVSHPDALAPAACPAAPQAPDPREASPTQREAEDIALVVTHPLFDADWYEERTPGLAASGLSPAAHFVLIGGHEGRSPGPDFDLLNYLDRRHDVEQSGMNAFVHFLRFGDGSAHATGPKA